MEMEMTTQTQQSLEERLLRVEKYIDSLSSSQDSGQDGAAEPNQRTSIKYEDDIDGKSRVFAESTHKFLVYFALEPSGGSVNGIIIALFVMALQFFLFSVMFSEGVREVDYQFNDAGIPVVASLESCYAFEYKVTKDAPPVKSDNIFFVDNEAIEDGGVRCANDPETLAKQLDSGSTYFYIGASCLLMACFLLEDVLSCFKILLTKTGKWAKFAALLILALTTYAFVAGIYFALAGVLAGSSYDGLVNCVGVLFVQDIDEKVYAAMIIVNKTEMTAARWCRWCRKYAPATCTICCMVLMLVIGLCVAFTIVAVDEAEADGQYGMSFDEVSEHLENFYQQYGYYWGWTTTTPAPQRQ